MESLHHPTPLVLTRSLDLLLRTVYAYRLLSPTQVTRLLYKPGMITTVRSRLKTLADHKYLLRNERATKGIGQKPVFYSLARKGLNYLKEQGCDVRNRYRPVEEKELSYGFIKHTLALNDVLIASSLLPKQVPGIRIFSMLHEQVLKHMKITVSFPTRWFDEEGTEKPTSISVEPDGWLDIRIHREGKRDMQWGIWIEVDRGTEERLQFKKKLRGILTIIESGRYFDVFKTRFVKVAFPTTSGMDRVFLMREWARQVLHITHERGSTSQLFLFSALPHYPDDPEVLGEIDPYTLFCTPVWYAPFSDTTKFSLLNLP